MFNIFSTNKINTVTVAQAAKSIKEDKKSILIDVREVNEYQAGHPNGAISYPLSTINSKSAEQLKQYESVYVICQSGGRSVRAATLLSGMGINAINVSGGTAAWRSAGLDMQ